jgi:D-beta-D-heptose 7-phosphate kinase/D-beta-D-heptose 1-phosphate adenosyltransferase
MTQPGERLRSSLDELGGGKDTLIVDDSRPSTTKTRIIAHNQLVVRADRESRKPVTANIEDQIIARLKQILEDASRLWFLTMIKE